MDELAVAFDKLDYQMLMLILTADGEKGYARGVWPFEWAYVTPGNGLRLAVLIDRARRR